MKVLAVGDVHTKMWIIDRVMKLVDNYDSIVFCGDYADDWQATAQNSIDTWKKLFHAHEQYPDKLKPIVGNHDYIYTRQTPSRQTGFNHETQNLLNLPENEKLKRWLGTLPLLREIDGVVYSHAGIDKSWNGDVGVANIWQNNSPIWLRPEGANYRNVLQVTGHTPRPTCTEVKPGIWLIDTFSTYADGAPIGDHTVLEVNGGKEFKVIRLW